MIRRRRFVFLWVVLLLAISGALLASVNDNNGKEWRQLTETVGLSWNQVGQACPQRDGISPCTGIAGGVDLTGWVWATDAQVTRLFSYFEPAILTSPTVSGMAQFFTASNFFSSFRPTQSVALDYFAFQNAAGWTSSFDEPASLAGFARVGMGNTPVSINGEFSVGLRINPNEVDFARGVFLWRDTGLNSGAALAYDDAGMVASPAGGIAVANVLDNDWLAGARPTTGTAELTQVSSTHPGVALNVFDGSVGVAGAQAGTYTLVYQICPRSNPANCDLASVTVTGKPYVIDAANDRLGAMPATVANVTLSLVSSANPGVTLDSSDGSVDVAQGTPFGTFALVYRICETANPANCDSATAAVTVKPYDIVAVNNQVRASSKSGGTVIASVLSNDWFAGSRATTATVRLSLVSLTPASKGISLDLSDGSVDVLPKTDSGLYKLVYQICEIASPTNCSQATASIDLSGK